MILSTKKAENGGDSLQKKVSTLLTQLSWSCHLLIMSGCKSDEEREFYIRLAIKERYSYRQLERQMDSGYYERYMLSKEKLLPEKVKSEFNPFLDSYVMEFLDLPTGFLEKDLRKGLIAGMKQFMLEIGKDFTFIDEEYGIHRKAYAAFLQGIHERARIK